MRTRFYAYSAYDIQSQIGLALSNMNLDFSNLTDITIQLIALGAGGNEYLLIIEKKQ